MSKARKKPCRICRKWFLPDPRVGQRQRACSKPECQTVRRKKTQASWRDHNPGYGAAYRIDQRNPPPPSRSPEPLRVPAPLDQLPWEMAKDEFGGKGADFIGLMGRLLLRAAKDQIPGYPIDPNTLSGTLPSLPEKTSGKPVHTETRAAPDAVPGISSTEPPLGAPPGPPPGASAPPDRLAG